MRKIYNIVIIISIIQLYKLPNSNSQWIVPREYYPNHSNQCRTPLNEVGQCISLQMCPEVLELFKSLPRNQATTYSRTLKSLCGNRSTPDNYPILCCTHPSTSETPTTELPRTTTTRRSIPESTTDWLDSIVKINGEPCTSPSGEQGLCKPLKNCSLILDPLQQNPASESIRSYIRASHDKCGYEQTDVCCPTANTRRSGTPNTPDLLLTEEQGCGISEHLPILPKIIGGEPAAPGSWPWAALLGYGDRESKRFRCGGTLITARHVITAAHCISEEPTFVRLGEYDLNNDTDTEHVDINISKLVIHPDYLAVKKRFDIAIVLMESPVKFTEFIIPICLVNNDLRKKSFVDYSPFVVGWGRTQQSGISSNILLQVQIKVHNMNVCRNKYLAINNRFKESMFDDTVVCAGNLLGGKDSCQGDSGGPLMIPEKYKGLDHFYLIGVVSYGYGCGVVGMPGIYTSVQYFMDWIEQTLADPA